MSRLGIDPSTLPDQMDLSRWGEAKEAVAAAFRTKTRDEWSEIFDGTDACVAPILWLDEMMDHPHNQERESFVDVAGQGLVPAPAPRLSRTPGTPPENFAVSAGDTRAVLSEYGLDSARIETLIESGAASEAGS